ncbi:MAG TPA: rod shape-determining protein [Candidatus Dormibacteraeota bacterium]|nr:rod shape-determining protein [Candidatus Dormibacteraeota bacterium]
MLSKKIGIDLGTSTVLVYVKGEGVVLNEPALMATDEKSRRVLAIGRAASDLVDRGGKVKAFRPVRNGDGVDYDAAGVLVQHVINRIIGRQRLFRPDVMLSVPPMVTGVERRAVLEATMQAGAKTAYLIDKPMAAAIGARVAVATTEGVLVVNLGAGSTDVAAIAQGEILALETLRVGGEALDAAIDGAVMDRHKVRLSPGEAERLKLGLGSATALSENASLEASATNASGGAVQQQIAAAEVQAAIREPLDTIAAGIQRVGAQVPAERQAALRRNGIILTGGGAQLRGMAEFISARTGIPARIARDPQTCVAVGTGMALDNLQVIRRGQHYIT